LIKTSNAEKENSLNTIFQNQIDPAGIISLLALAPAYKPDRAVGDRAPLPVCN
jgi:hypothetical protein